MRMQKRPVRFIAPALVLALVLLLGGCGGSSASEPAAYSYDDYAPVPQAPMEDVFGWSEGEYYDNYATEDVPAASTPAAEGGSADGGTPPTLTQPQDGRKIVMNAYISMESTEFDKALAELTRAVQAAGGYTSYSSISGDKTYGDRYANYTFKIPADKYTDFISATEKAGTVVSRDESSQDVTDQYVDIEARLKSLRAQEARLLEMLEETAKLSDLMEVQRQLTEVQYEIEGYLAQQRTLDQLTAYSTVEVYLYEVRVDSPTPEDSYNTEVQRAFRESWGAMGDFLQQLGLGLVWLVPVLLMLLVVAIPVLIVVFIVRAIIKRRRKKHPKPETPPIVNPFFYTGGLNQPPPAPGAPPAPAAPPPPDKPDDAPKA